MAYTFTLPRSFDPLEFLATPRLQLRADDARWFVNTILQKTARRDIDAWGCVRLHSRILRRLLYEPTMGDIMKALQNGGVIDIAPYYRGRRCKGYRLGRRFLGDRCKLVPAHDPRLLARIENERQRHAYEENRSRWQKLHFDLNAEQRHVTLAMDADQILVALPEHTRLCQDVLVTKIRQRDFSLSVAKTGRVFNCVTNLKRELRGALRIDGTPVGSVDICCAQPALLGLLLQQQRHASGVDTLGPSLVPSFSSFPSADSPDADLFCDLACSGSLYERLMADTGLDRDTVKKRFLVDVLAKRGKYPSAVEQAFRNAFPHVFKFITWVNRDNHAELIRVLQTLESSLVIGNVSPKLLGHVPFVTLHDAIFSRWNDTPVVEGAFAAVFSDLGFRLGLKREHT
jgi:hypothetical protein